MPTPQPFLPRYASHALRLGDLVARYPLVAWQEGEGFSLATFTEEGERTIFLSGKLELHHPDFPMRETAEPTEVSLEALADLLTTATGWELRYAGQLLLPPP